MKSYHIQVYYLVAAAAIVTDSVFAFFSFEDFFNFLVCSNKLIILVLPQAQGLWQSDRASNIDFFCLFESSVVHTGNLDLERSLKSGDGYKPGNMLANNVARFVLGLNMLKMKKNLLKWRPCRYARQSDVQI